MAASPTATFWPAAGVGASSTPRRSGSAPRATTLAAVAEPGGSGPLGPYPPGVDSDEQRVEYDKLRRRVLWRLPVGLYVLRASGAPPAAPNLMTLHSAPQP